MLLVSVTMALCLVDGGALVAPILLISRSMFSSPHKLLLARRLGVTDSVVLFCTGEGGNVVRCTKQTRAG